MSDLETRGPVPAGPGPRPAPVVASAPAPAPVAASGQAELFETVTSASPAPKPPTSAFSTVESPTQAPTTIAPGEDGLLGRIELIEAQPLPQRASGFEQLHDELLADLQRGDQGGV